MKYDLARLMKENLLKIKKIASDNKPKSIYEDDIKALRYLFEERRDLFDEEDRLGEMRRQSQTEDPIYDKEDLSKLKALKDSKNIDQAEQLAESLYVDPYGKDGDEIYGDKIKDLRRHIEFMKEDSAPGIPKLIGTLPGGKPSINEESLRNDFLQLFSSLGIKADFSQSLFRYDPNKSFSPFSPDKRVFSNITLSFPSYKSVDGKIPDVNYDQKYSADLEVDAEDYYIKTYFLLKPIGNGWSDGNAIGHSKNIKLGVKDLKIELHFSFNYDLYAVRSLGTMRGGKGNNWFLNISLLHKNQFEEWRTEAERIKSNVMHNTFMSGNRYYGSPDVSDTDVVSRFRLAAKPLIYSGESSPSTGAEIGRVLSDITSKPDSIDLNLIEEQKSLSREFREAKGPGIHSDALTLEEKNLNQVSSPEYFKQRGDALMEEFYKNKKKISES